MNRLHLYTCILFFLSLFMVTSVYAQPSFVDKQKTYSTAATAFNNLEDSIKKQFEAKNLSWPPQSLYIRSFKYDRLLELWVRQSAADSFVLFKTYKVCMQSGTIGPKRYEGDNQVPEGFYYVNEFNPNSNYHLSLGINYPNASDKILSDVDHPGGEIYIHGNCVSTGCIAIQDVPMEEVYIVASHAKAAGQDFIPVHIFPVKYDVKKSLNYLTQTVKGKQAVHKFTLTLKSVFDHFETNRKLPVIMIDKKGDYVIN
jgi:murein L,D-transpeptidase YafK